MSSSSPKTIQVIDGFICRAIRISYQSSVTCDGQYRKHVIEPQSSFHDGLHDVKFDAKRKRLLLLPAALIYHIQKIFRICSQMVPSFLRSNINPHTVRGRSTLNGGLVNEHAGRSAKRVEYFSDGLAETKPEIKRVING